MYYELGESGKFFGFEDLEGKKGKKIFYYIL